MEKWSRESLYDSRLQEVSLGWKPLHLRYKDTINDVEEYRVGELDEEQTGRVVKSTGKEMHICYAC